MASLINTKSDIPLTGLRRFKGMFRNPRARREILAKWSKIYAAAIRKRFVKFSRGGGNWKRLAPSTLQRRRNRNKRSAAILRDTGLLFAALRPSFVKSRVKSGGDIIGVVSFGRTKRYPGGPTVGQVIVMHDRGGPNLPKRRILVRPDAKTRKKMGAVASRIAAKYIKQ